MGEMPGKRKVYSRVHFVLVIGVMLLIFMLSSQPGTDSNALSNQFIHSYKFAVEHFPFLSDTTRAVLLAKPSHYVRKLAHLTIFALLGGTTFLTLWQRKKSFLSCMICAVFICLIYAGLDEWHQYYVIGREANLSDVFLDTLGASIGSLIAGLMQIRISFIRKKKYKK